MKETYYRFVSTKLHPPVRDRGVITRRRLMSLISNCRDHTLTVVRAPTGYGKSTALAQWYLNTLEAGDIISWLSLDSEDNDPNRFYAHLVASIRSLSGDFGATILGQIKTGIKVPAETFAITIINEFAELKSASFLLIDDFQFIHAQPVIDAIRYIVESAPSNLHLLIASRNSLPLPLARLRACGQLLEIDVADLRFFEDEALSFFQQISNSQVTSTHVNILSARTEGWIAGMQLASLSLENASDIDTFINSFSGKYQNISDFLAENVLQMQTKELREFLLTTSILERLNPELCDYLAGIDNSRQMLDQIESSGLFIFALDYEHNWYRYHHMFSEFLRKRLQEKDANKVEYLHLRASQWFEESGYPDEAIKYAMQAESFERAAALLDTHCNNMFYMGQLRNLMEWCNRIPEKYLQKYPNILLNKGWEYILEWKFTLARQLLNKVEEQINAFKGTSCKTVDCDLSFVLTHHEMMFAEFSDDMRSAERHCLTLMEHFTIDDDYLQGNLYTSLIHSQKNLYKLEKIPYYDTCARQYYNNLGSQFVLVWHECIIGMAYHVRAELQRSECAFRKAMTIATEIGGSESGLAAMPALLLAEICYERNELKEAGALLERYLPLADQIGFVDQLIAGYICSARIAALERNYEYAYEVLEKADECAKKFGFSRLGHHVLAEVFRISAQTIKDGNLKEFWKNRLDKKNTSIRTPKGDVTSREAVQATAFIRYLCLSGELKSALNLSRQWVKLTKGRGAVRDEVRFSLLLAKTQYLSGDKSGGYRTLRDLLLNNKAAEMCRTYIDEGEPIISLLSEICKSLRPDSIVMQTASRLVLNAGGALNHPVWTETQAECQVLVDRLTGREVEILEYVSAGLRNIEIAAELGLTEGSVKWYMQMIFNKLNTRRRTVAVERARQLGLLR